jgi:hypothetical protein
MGMIARNHGLLNISKRNSASPAEKQSRHMIPGSHYPFRVLQLCEIVTFVLFRAYRGIRLVRRRDDKHVTDRVPYKSPVYVQFRNLRIVKNCRNIHSVIPICFRRFRHVMFSPMALALESLRITAANVTSPT